MSQGQEDEQIHPVAYASRALSLSEHNYSITEMETLAVVWAITHFQFYLYGCSVIVYTDHTAVKAVQSYWQAWTLVDESTWSRNKTGQDYLPLGEE